MKNFALISVSNKMNLKTLCNVLKKFKISIISTGNTHKAILKLGYNSKLISDYTNYNEILDGRVKTLHPKIHGGILFDRKNKYHARLIKKEKIPEIDIVIANLYPFIETIKKSKNIKKIIENIDIGGHTLIRSSAKNYQYVTTICDPKDYDFLVKELIKNNGKTRINFRKKFAGKAFKIINEYDYNINNWFNKNSLSQKKTKVVKLRYGENPHQKGSFHSVDIIGNEKYKQISGKKLSYNNINDIDSAINCLLDFKKPTSVIVKHASPCGVASNKTITKAFTNSYESDKTSAYGGILAVNREVDSQLAGKISKIFFEIVIGTGFTDNAIKILGNKKNLILIKTKNNIIRKEEQKSVVGGYLIQDCNKIIIDQKKLKCVTKYKANKKTLQDLFFAFLGKVISGLLMPSIY